MASPNTATSKQHFFNAPDSASLAAAFYDASVSLATGKAKLIQLYPTPVVTSAGGATSAVTISGK